MPAGWRNDLDAACHPQSRLWGRARETNQGQQVVIPATGLSALQAAKERGEKMRPKKPQADPGPLFETREKPQPDRFGEPK